MTGNNPIAGPNGKHGGSQIHSVLSFSKTSWQALRPCSMGTGISSVTNKWTFIMDTGNFIFAYLYLGGCPVWNIFTILSWEDAVSPLLPPKFYDRPLYLHGIRFLLVVWRLLQIARLWIAAYLAYTQIRSCPPPGTQSSFQLLCVPLPIPLKLTAWRNTYIIHVTSNWALRHRLVVSHITKHSAPLNSVARGHILLHGILLWLTDTAARDHMIHRYCGTSAYYDSPVLGKGSHYDTSSVLRPVLSTVSYYDS